MRRRTVATLILALLGSLSSAVLMLRAVNPCALRSRLTVVCVLAALMVALCLRMMKEADRKNRQLLLAAISIAAATLFVDARFVLMYKEACFTPAPPATYQVQTPSTQ